MLIPRQKEVYLRPNDIACHVNGRKCKRILEIHNSERCFIEHGNNNVACHPRYQYNCLYWRIVQFKKCPKCVVYIKPDIIVTPPLPHFSETAQPWQHCPIPRHECSVTWCQVAASFGKNCRHNAGRVLDLRLFSIHNKLGGFPHTLVHFVFVRLSLQGRHNSLTSIFSKWWPFRFHENNSLHTAHINTHERSNSLWWCGLARLAIAVIVAADLSILRI